MRHVSRVVLLCLVAALAGAGLVSASGFGLFQHGGRAMGQVGAFTARAPEPSALTYNPAAITKLEGFQLQAGLDFNNAQDEYSSATGTFNARHIIQFPPAVYATWKQAEGPFALGIGIDSPFYYSLDWNARLFPGRFVTRRVELRVYEVHPVLAYDLGEGWSFGGGVRYAFGNLDQDDNGRFTVSAGAAPPVSVEVERNASSDIDAFAWDLAVHYAAPSWGWGAVYRSPERLKGNGDVDYEPRDVPPGIPGLEAALRGRFVDGSVRQSFELPREVRAGLWYAPYPELRLELDASFTSWSSLEATDVTYDPDAFRDGPTVSTRRDWKDTTSLRLGVEGDITDNFLLFGGVALEPSPVPDRRVEPGFPRGDAMVYGAGFTYSFPQLSFDVGYSFHDHDDRGARGQELLNPNRAGSYGASDQVWGFAVRWRL
ncbi:MAG TPA: outer membrane protein transport protein [Thermoanaerobaculia bacterium]|jgi:long-chain fatty acid transport protein|nr:outer membrane protein transport protein [Thermoanaerobaculia bacterium]